MLHSTQKLRRQRSTYNNIVSLAYDQWFFVYFVLFLSGVGRHLTPQHFFLLLLFVLVATEAETVQCTHYKDFKTRRDLNLFVQCVCCVAHLFNARDYPPPPPQKKNKKLRLSEHAHTELNFFKMHHFKVSFPNILSKITLQINIENHLKVRHKHYIRLAPRLPK